MRRRVGVGVLVAVGLVLVGGAGVRAAPRAHSRHFAHPPAPRADALAQRWSTPVTGYVGGIAADDDAVVVMSGGQTVSLLAGADGRVRWSVAVPNLVNDEPALGSDIAVVPVDGGVVALARADGQQRWALRGADGAVAAIAAPDSVVIGTDNGTVALLDAATGTVRWQATRPGRIRVAPAIGSDSISVVALGPDAADLAVLDRATGTMRWSAEVAGGASGPLVVDGLVVVGAGDRQLVARHLSDATVAWSVPTAAGFESLTRPGPATTPTGVLVVAADRFGGVTAVDVATGRTRWSGVVGPAAAILMGAPVASGDHVVIGGLLSPSPLTVFSLAEGRRGPAPPPPVPGVVAGIAATRNGIVFGLRRVTPGRVEMWGW